MVQSHVWITHTQLDEERLSTAIAAEFFDPHTYNFGLFLGTSHSPTLPSHMAEELANFAHTMTSHGRILYPDLTSKKDFKKYSLELYQNFAQPTLLFLGNLSQYSHTVQEGMLKLLEEPPHNLTIATFIQSRSEVLPTIASRSTIHTLSDQLIRDCISAKLVEKTAGLFPNPQHTVQSLLRKNIDMTAVLKNIAKAERNQIDFWLWQLEYVCIHLLQSSAHESVVQLIATIQKARKLNTANVQKKLVLMSMQAES